MCRVFSVSASGYNAWLTRPASARSLEDQTLGSTIETIFSAKKKRYGAVRITRELRTRGMCVSTKRTARLMRQRGLRASQPRRRVQTTDSRHDHPIAENLLERDFTASAPNQKFAGDITYVQTGEHWLYLAVILDLFNREIVGWAMSNRIDQTLTQSAMRMALSRRQPTGPIIMHTDRGVQYAAGDYRRLLRDWGVIPSMSRRGNCYDNAVSESFFATLKKELIYRERYATHDEARTSIFEYIEVFYNRERLHSTINYMTPVAFLKAWQAEQQNSATSSMEPALQLSISCPL
jgi:putative transposase